VELRAPDGNSVTLKVYRSNSVLLALLKSKGYTVVEPA
jgi:hypothetical protein